MNSFPKSELVFSEADIVIPILPNYKFKKQDVCRNGLFKNNLETIRRKPDSAEFEFEHQCNRSQINEQELSKYRIANMVHKTDTRRETVQDQNVISHKEETRETKIFIIERRSGSISGRVALAFWRRLKKLTGTDKSKQPKAIEGIPSSTFEDRKFSIQEIQNGVLEASVLESALTPKMRSKKHFFGDQQISLETKPRESVKKKLPTSKSNKRMLEIVELESIPESNYKIILPVNKIPRIEEPLESSTSSSSRKLFTPKVMPVRTKSAMPVPLKT